MTLAAERGWANVSLRDIADRAGVPLSALRRAGVDKNIALILFAREIDDAAAACETEGSAVERLFDVVMARFDAMLGWRDGLRVIWRDLKGDPAAALSLAGEARASIRWTLEAASLSSSGAAGAARVAALAAILLHVFSVWLDDDLSQNKTMAALDRGLQKCRKLLQDDGNSACGSYRDVKDTASSFSRNALKRAASAFSSANGVRRSPRESDGDA